MIWWRREAFTGRPHTAVMGEGVILPSKGHLAVSGDILALTAGGYYWHLVYRPGMLLNVPQGTEQLPTPKNYPAQNVSGARLRNHDSTKWKTPTAASAKERDAGLIPHFPEKRALPFFLISGLALPSLSHTKSRHSLCNTRDRLMYPYVVNGGSETWECSLVTKDVPILVRVESKLENPIHHTPFDGQLGVLKLLLARVLPYDVLGHRAIKELQKVFYLSSFIVSCCELLKVSNAK